MDICWWAGEEICATFDRMKHLLAAMLLLAPVAFAQDASQIADYNLGKYEQAAAISGIEQTPDLLAFKARAMLASGICGNGQPSAELLVKAEKFARAALARDANHVEAQLQLAITLSLKARPLSNRAAMKTGYGEDARELALKALSTEPSNPYANGFLAVWHIEVVRRGGPIGSRVMGASVKKARKYYEIAEASASGDAALHWQYARALAALNSKKYRKEIASTLAKATSATVDNHVEKTMAERANKLQQMLQLRPHKEVEDWAENML